MTKENYYLEKNIRDLENLLIYYNTCLKETLNNIELIKEAIKLKNKNER